MQKLITWLSESFAPKMKKVFANPWLAALSSAMQKNIPFILTGSIIYFYQAIRSHFLSLPDLGIIASFSFGMLGIITAFFIANQIMEKLRLPQYTVNAGLTSICVFLVFCNPNISNGLYSVSFERLGPTGILIGIITGVIVALVFSNYNKLGLTSKSTMPDFINKWIDNIVPICVLLGIATLAVFKLNIDIFNVIVLIFSPLISFGQTLPGFILLSLIPAFFYSMGISTWTFQAIQIPVFMAGINGNIQQVAAGLTPDHFVTFEIFYTAGLITMGGVGCTLALNILMMLSKKKDLKSLGYVCIGPSLFNINEPLMYGGPVIFNPMLMIPLWINAITGPVVVWAFMKFEWMDVPAKIIQVGQIPPPFGSVLVTGDFRALICYALLFTLYLLTWFPFFKAYEKTR